MVRMLGATHAWLRCGELDDRPAREARMRRRRVWRSREKQQWTREYRTTAAD